MVELYGLKFLNDNLFLQASAFGNGLAVGDNVMLQYALPTNGDWYWIGVVVLLGYCVLFTVIMMLALAYLRREFFLPSIFYFLS